MQKVMSRSELFELVEDSEHVSMSNWRWGWSELRVIELHGAHWLFNVQYHHNDGLQHYDGQPVLFTKAKKETTETWVAA